MEVDDEEYRRLRRVESAARKLTVEVHHAVLLPEWFASDSQAVRANLLTWAIKTRNELENRK